MRFIKTIFATLMVSSLAFGAANPINEQNKDIFVKAYKAYWNLQLKKQSSTVYRLTSFDGSAASNVNFGYFEVGGKVHKVAADVNLTQASCSSLWGNSTNKTVYSYVGRDSTKATSVGYTSPSTDISGGSNVNLKIAVDNNPVVAVGIGSLTGLNTGAKIATALQTAINAALIAAGQGSSVTVAYSTVYTVTSNLAGGRSKVVITAGASLDLAADVKLGVANTGTETAGVVGVGLCVSDVAGLSTVGSTAIANSGYVSCSVAFPSTTAIRQIGSNSLNCTGPVIGTIVPANSVSTGTIVNADISSSAAIDSTKLDPTVVQYSASVALTQTQIQGMSVTPISLVADPGAGKIIMVDEVEVLHTYSTTAYANGGHLQVVYHGSTTILEMATATVTGTSSKTYMARPSAYDIDNSTGTGPADMTALGHLGVDLTNASAAFINGNAANVIKVRVKYHIITLQT